MKLTWIFAAASVSVTLVSCSPQKNSAAGTTPALLPTTTPTQVLLQTPPLDTGGTLIQGSLAPEDFHAIRRTLAAWAVSPNPVTTTNADGDIRSTFSSGHEEWTRWTNITLISVIAPTSVRLDGELHDGNCRNFANMQKANGEWRVISAGQGRTIDDCVFGGPNEPVEVLLMSAGLGGATVRDYGRKNELIEVGVNNSLNGFPSLRAVPLVPLKP